MKRLSVGILAWLLLAHILVVAQSAKSQKQVSKGSTYFYMDLDGSYKYAFDTGEGFAGAQSADQTNEVRGQYLYYEQGVPLMVKYRAGRRGYQPEVFQAPSSSQLAELRFLTAPPINMVSTKPTTLQFVENALRSLQTQSLHVSFAPQTPATKKTTTTTTTTPKIESNVPRLLPVFDETNDIEARSIKKRPYAYSYLAGQSAHSERADQSGNVLGKYSYYDAAGYHDLDYKAGDDIGFVIVGGNLAQPTAVKPTVPTTTTTTTTRKRTTTIDAAGTISSYPANEQAAQVVVNVSHLPSGSYNYKVETLPSASTHTYETVGGKTQRNMVTTEFRRQAWT